MSAIITISNFSKTFKTREGEHVALRNVDLEIPEGSVFGIIGLSGAGKSTLVRAINGIAPASGGSITVLGQDVTNLSGKKLRSLRQNIGMVFQQFNLMPSRTVLQNVLLPLKDSGLKRNERKQRAEHLLELVGLAKFKDAYPSQLSGGQSQRVAIARALANSPKLLLCDEATSALDPETTDTILRLLKRLNSEFGITIIVVTHQMDVIKAICTDVAVIDKGTIVEQGGIYDVMSNPQASLAAKFVENSTGLTRFYRLINEGAQALKPAEDEVLIHMQYVRKAVSEALVSQISVSYALVANIFYGSLEIIDGYPLGGLIVKLRGKDDDITQALQYLRDQDVKVTDLTASFASVAPDVTAAPASVSEQTS
ncbi:methionine ABC transporter ATP-binding protein [Bifidobacterium sp.]|jgi:D-methionine transport system ATP-binding protein|uniref:methionine ABC transporter ATP-binding protein n=1 Tax=Bifidobacterium sp. TaxID=41200 RepID=UPI0025BED99A|nr:ATP-binding cassette domain-containing protein [Bifidobacterium sp.]MCI1636219.1 ATP-binding cassette domain-containing protein [Bifidobacterium sp.]